MPAAVAQQQRDALQADEGRDRHHDRRQSQRGDQQALQQAEADGERHDEDEPAGKRKAVDAVGREKGGKDHAEPGERADRQVDGADENGGELCARQEGEDAEERQHALDADRRQEIAVQGSRPAR